MPEMNSIKFREMSVAQKHFYINMAAAIVKDNVTTVSFDIFDTLVMRPFLCPTDLFFLMEKDFSAVYTGKKSFHELRILAEAKARKKCKSGEANLSEIYEMLEKISGISPYCSKELMKREQALEVHFCYPRDCGMRLFHDAVEAGKDIILTTDMYLPSETITEILKSCNITGYKGIFLSNSMRMNKAGGAVYKAIVNKLKIKPEQLIHVGDNVHSDVEIPISLGFDALYFPSCCDLMEKSGNLYGYIQNKLGKKFCSVKYLSLRCLLALYADYAFDYPFDLNRKQSDFCGIDENVGFVTLGGINLFKEYVESDMTLLTVLGAMSKSKKMVAASEKCAETFDDHFGEFLEKYDFAGCNLPFDYFARHGCLQDRMMIENFMPSLKMKEWSAKVTEITNKNKSAYSENSAKKRFTDKFFPRGSFQRKIINKLLQR